MKQLTKNDLEKIYHQQVELCNNNELVKEQIIKHLNNLIEATLVSDKITTYEIARAIADAEEYIGQAKALLGTGLEGLCSEITQARMGWIASELEDGNYDYEQHQFIHRKQEFIDANDLANILHAKL